MKMDFFEVIDKRRSIRKYLSKEIPDGVLKKILEAANKAPSAMNEQPWEFIVVKDKNLKGKLREIYSEAREKLNFYKQDASFLGNATLILALADKSKSSPIISTAMAVENMLLAATALGLGANCMTSPITLEEDANLVKGIFNIPKNYEVILLVAIGYPDEGPGPKQKTPAQEKTHYNRFGKK